MGLERVGHDWVAEQHRVKCPRATSTSNSNKAVELEERKGAKPDEDKERAKGKAWIRSNLPNPHLFYAAWQNRMVAMLHCRQEIMSNHCLFPTGLLFIKKHISLHVLKKLGMIQYTNLISFPSLSWGQFRSQALSQMFNNKYSIQYSLLKKTCFGPKSVLYLPWNSPNSLCFHGLVLLLPLVIAEWNEGTCGKYS